MEKWYDEALSKQMNRAQDVLKSIVESINNIKDTGAYQDADWYQKLKHLYEMPQDADWYQKLRHLYEMPRFDRRIEIWDGDIAEEKRNRQFELSAENISHIISIIKEHNYQQPWDLKWTEEAAFRTICDIPIEIPGLTVVPTEDNTDPLSGVLILGALHGKDFQLPERPDIADSCERKDSDTNISSRFHGNFENFIKQIFKYFKDDSIEGALDNLLTLENPYSEKLFWQYDYCEVFHNDAQRLKTISMKKVISSYDSILDVQSPEQKLLILFKTLIYIQLTNQQRLKLLAYDFADQERKYDFFWNQISQVPVTINMKTFQGLSPFYENMIGHTSQKEISDSFDKTSNIMPIVFRQMNHIRRLMLFFVASNLMVYLYRYISTIKLREMKPFFESVYYTPFSTIGNWEWKHTYSLIKPFFPSKDKRQVYQLYKKGLKALAHTYLKKYQYNSEEYRDKPEWYQEHGLYERTTILELLSMMVICETLKDIDAKDIWSKEYGTYRKGRKTRKGRTTIGYLLENIRTVTRPPYMFANIMRRIHKMLCWFFLLPMCKRESNRMDLSQMPERIKMFWNLIGSQY